jgi:acyl-CoA thioester hydrolase
MSDTRLFSVQLSLEPKTYDIDFSGIVSNIVYIRWLEDLRLVMLDTHFSPLTTLLQSGVCPVLLRTQIDYRRAIMISDKPAGEMWVSNCTPVKWVLSAEISVRGRTAALAQQTGGFLDLSTKQAIPIPDAVYSKMEAALRGAQESV